MTLGSTLSDIWHRFQGELFPALAEEVGPLLEVHKRFVTALDLVRVERFVGEVWNGPGRPQEDRRALARGFIAKAVWDPADDPPSDRQAQGGPDAAETVRLVACRGDPERGDVFTGVCRVLAVPYSGEDARGPG